MRVSTTADLFRPSARAGADLTTAMRHKLASSFRHLEEACAPHVLLDRRAVSAKLAEIEIAERVRPDLYIIHHDCREAAIRDDLGAVQDAFAELCRAPVAATPGLRRRDWGSDGFSRGERARYQWAFGDEGDTAIRLTAAAPAVVAEALAAFDGALDALRRADGELHGEILALVGEVVFAGSEPGAAVTFDGITTPNAFGANVLNPVEQRTVPVAIAGLVHEAAHALLFAAGEGHSLVDNAPGERFQSPLRADPRPMNGIVHATFVLARMAYALERVLAAGVLAEADRAEAAALLSGSREAFFRGQSVVEAHGRTTPLGAGFMRDASAYMRA